MERVFASNGEIKGSKGSRRRGRNEEFVREQVESREEEEDEWRKRGHV